MGVSLETIEIESLDALWNESLPCCFERCSEEVVCEAVFPEKCPCGAHLVCLEHRMRVVYLATYRNVFICGKCNTMLGPLLDMRPL